MSRMEIMLRVRLGPSNEPTGATRHYYGSGSGWEPAPPPRELAICRFPGDDGYYLLYLDDEGTALTDTHHATVEQAMHQAEFEFGVKRGDWEDLQDN